MEEDSTLHALELKAFRAFQYGRYAECEGLLVKAVDVAESSGSRWTVACNLLSCRTHTAAGDQDKLTAVYRQSLQLWDVLKGLPAREETMLTELSLACNLAWLQLVLEEQCCYDAAASALWSTLSERHPQLQPTRQLLQLAFCATVQSLLSDGAGCEPLLDQCLTERELEGDGFDRLAKLQLKFSSDSPSVRHQLCYRQAWDAFNDGCYGDALSLLAPPTVSAPGRLLAGCCYAKLSKPNMALCCYQQCILQTPPPSPSPSSSSSSALLAMANACEVLRAQGSIEAEIQLRLLLIEALKCAEGSSSSSSGGVGRAVLWRTDAGSVSKAAAVQLELASVAYHTAKRAMQLHKYELASQLLKELLPSPGHPSHHVHLLCVKSLLCLGEFEEAIQLCSRLEAVFLPVASPPTKRDDHAALLVLAQSWCFRSHAAFSLLRIPEAKSNAERCVQLCHFLQQQQQSAVCGASRLISELWVCSLSTLALVSVGYKQHNRALQLLTDAVAIAAAGLPAQPTHLVYNCCLVWLKLGRLPDSAHQWLAHRWKEQLPWERGTLRARITAASSTLGTMNDSMQAYHFTAMDCAMLKVILTHK